MTNTYTTAGGTKLEVIADKVTVTTATGSTHKFDLARTTQSHQHAGCRTLGTAAFKADAADWIDAQYAAYKQSKEDALEANVPGIHEALTLSAAASNESARYRRDFNRMMDDESNDGARPPKPENHTASEKLSVLLANNPRAALYLKAKSQDESTSWADNTGKGAAGRKAMEILATGGSIEDATAALAVRREFID